MASNELTPIQLRERGYAALLRELGPVDFIRFMQQFGPGHGDHAQDRSECLDRVKQEQIDAVIDRQRRCTRSRSAARNVRSHA